MAVDFDGQPTLEGPRVIVRPIAVADWQPLFAAASDPKIWEQHPASDRYTERAFRRFFDQAINSGSAFAFVHRESGEIFGSSRYHGFDPVAREVEIGWTFLTRGYWGGSYNAEIKRLMIDHAFQFVDTVVFWIGQTNTRSRRAIEKLGAVRRDGIHFRGGEDSPYVVYEIRKGS